MFCPNCGVEISDNATVCSSCGANLNEINQEQPSQQTQQPQQSFQQPPQQFTNQPMQSQQPSYQYQQVQPQYNQQYNQQFKPNINNYLVWSILCTIFCCLPCGIVGIVYSNKVNTALNMGNIEEAIKSSKTAKTWNLVGTIIGAVITLIYTLIVIFGAAAEFSSYMMW